MAPHRDLINCPPAPGAALVRFISAERKRQASPAAVWLSEEIARSHPDCAVAVLHYGSCLRRGDDSGGIIDLYLLVDSYRHCYDRLVPRLLNRALPPNVFYREAQFQGRRVRTKYAIMTLAQFRDHVGGGAFTASLWARFAQPTALTWARDDAVAAAIDDCLAAAVQTFLGESLGLMDAPFTPGQWWRTGLQASYGAELRPERADTAAASLVAAEPERYEAVTRAALAGLPVGCDNNGGLLRSALRARARQRARRRWAARRVAGKALNLLRLIKALFTFDGGVDYALWKIERHSGVRVEPTALLRRYPLLGMWGMAWRLYRRGAFR